jgi:glucosamine-6-phosphate deaminase
LLHLARSFQIGTMTPRIYPFASDAVQAVAEEIIHLLQRKPDAVLGLATGATMEPVYQALIEAFHAGRISFAHATTFNLDEYVGLPPRHSGSYRATMHRLLFNHVDIIPSRTHVPDGMAADPHDAADRYESLIDKHGPIDLQLLGIGRNGHIGFNEPGSALDSRTRLVDLHAETLEANRPFFHDHAVPSQAITMGVASILSARRIAVLATGSTKQDAVTRALTGGVISDCPASALRRHADVTWFLDEAAAGRKAA